jgi:hypothetical protein
MAAVNTMRRWATKLREQRRAERAPGEQGGAKVEVAVEPLRV